MRRRELLWGGLATGALAAGGLVRPARAAPWGAPPPRGAVLARGQRAERVLEVFLTGGLGPFESFYVVPEYGRPDDRHFPSQQWWQFEPDHARYFGEICRFPSRVDLLSPFAVDALGRTVQLGPLALALRARPDVLARMRVVVCAHDQVPHEPAAPLSMCGLPLGSPRTASTGAHVNRYFQEREPDSGTPHAVVLDSVLPASADYWSFATRTGLHPASSRPLLLRLGGVVDLVDQLARTGVGDRRAAVDGLRSALASQLEGRMVDATGAPLRSAAVAAHRHAIVGLAGADALANVLTPEMLEPRLSAACDGPLALDIFGAGLSAAVGMLTHPTSPARYAAVIDHGLTPTNDNVSLDGHDRHLELHARNLPHTLRSVMDRLNEPGEGDPTKLDLDDTVVAFTTEFGRTPHGQPDSDQGTDHHPYGFVQVLIGGPVAPGIVGALGPDGIAVDPVTPAELRAGLLASLGMWPFTGDSFSAGDVPGATSDPDAFRRVVGRVLGVTA
jgi:hypothetical protein